MSEQENEDGKLHGLQNTDGTLSAAERAYLKYSRPAEADDDYDPDSPEAMGWEDLGHSWRTDTGITLRKDQLAKPVGDPSAAESYTEQQADPAQLMMMRDDISRLEAQLQDVVRYDPRTGAPIMRIRGEERRMLEVTLQGRKAQLPAMERMQQIASQWREAHVLTAEEKLQHQLDRQAAIYQAATARADALEADAMAKTIRTQRKAGGYQGS